LKDSESDVFAFLSPVRLPFRHTGNVVGLANDGFTVPYERALKQVSTDVEHKARRKIIP
jgi:hypothetical protein